jgi:phage terminase small subunit
MKREDGLTDKQAAFIDEYLIDLNATQAAIRAGYNKSRAEVTGHELVRNSKIAAVIKDSLSSRSERTQITADKVLIELARLGLSDARKLFDEGGNLLPVNAWPDEIAAAVSSIEVEEILSGKGEDRIGVGYTKKVKLWDKNAALANLAKHLGLLADKTEHSGAIELIFREVENWRSQQ